MSLFLKPIAVALNFALAQDPETQDKLKKFEHRSIAIKINDLKQTVFAEFNDKQLQLSSNADKEAHLTITSNAITLAKLGHDPESLFSSEIDIHGDVQFAKQLRDLLEGFDFDWEAQLARITGDTLAYPLAQSLRQAASWLKSSHSSLQQTSAEYLKEEIRILPDKSQIIDYMNDIDSLRADYDRIEARINRLI